MNRYKGFNINNIWVIGLAAITICFLSGPSAFAQEPARLLLMNGKYLDVISLDDTSRVDITYRFDKNFYRRENAQIKAARKLGEPYRPGQSYTAVGEYPVLWTDGTALRSDIFSATPPSGPEKVYYFYDEPLGNYLTEPQMRAFVMGERDARYAVRGRGWFYAGLAAGFGGGYALQGSVFTLAIPPLFALAAKIPIVKIKPEAIIDPQYRDDMDYASGYESVARSRYFIQGLKGSAIGAFLGLLTYSVVEANN